MLESGNRNIEIEVSESRKEQGCWNVGIGILEQRSRNKNLRKEIWELESEKKDLEIGID